MIGAHGAVRCVALAHQMRSPLIKAAQQCRGNAISGLYQARTDRAYGACRAGSPEPAGKSRQHLVTEEPHKPSLASGKRVTVYGSGLTPRSISRQVEGAAIGKPASARRVGADRRCAAAVPQIVDELAWPVAHLG